MSGRTAEELEQLLAAKEADLQQAALLIADVKREAQLHLLEQATSNVDLEIELQRLRAAAGESANKDALIASLTQQTAEYQSAIMQLKNVCIENVRAARSAEAMAAGKSAQLERIGNELATTTYFQAENAQAVRVLQELVFTDRELLQETEVLERELVAALQQKEKELSVYKEAFNTLARTATEREAESASAIKGLKARLAELEDLTAKQSRMLAPRWLQQTKKGSVSTAASVAALGGARLQMASAEARAAFLRDSAPTAVFARGLALLDAHQWLGVAVSAAEVIVAYVFSAHYKDLMADATENPESVVKDRGFVRALHMLVTTVGNVQRQACMLFEFLRRVSLDEALKVLGLGSLAEPREADDTTEAVEEGPVDSAKVSPVMNSLFRGFTALQELIDLASRDGFSTATDINAVTEFGEQLEKLITDLANDDSLPTKPEVVCVANGEACVSVPVLRSLLAVAASASVVGYTKSALVPNISSASTMELWESLWQAGEILSSRFPLSPALSATLRHGFGLCHLPRRNAVNVNKVIADADFALTQLGDLLMSTTEDPDATSKINNCTPRIGNMLEKLDTFSQNYTAANDTGNEAPLVTASAAALYALCGASQARAEAEQLRRRTARKDADLGELGQQLSRTKQQVEQRKAELQKLQLQLEKLTLDCKDLEALRASDVAYGKLVQEQLATLEAVRMSRRLLENENATLQKRLQEATQLLQSTRDSPLRQNQNEWDALEMAGLRALLKKLERENLALHARYVETELDPSDLAVFQAPATYEAQTRVPASGVPSAPLAAEAAAAVRKVAAELRVVRQEVMDHLCQIPCLRPAAPPQELTLYAERHTALRMKLSDLQHTASQFTPALTGVSRTTAGYFGDILSVAVDRKLKEGKTEGAKPAMRLSVPCRPWMAALGLEKYTTVTFLAQPEQLALLQHKLVG